MDVWRCQRMQVGGNNNHFQQHVIPVNLKKKQVFFTKHHEMLDEI